MGNFLHLLLQTATANRAAPIDGGPVYTETDPSNIIVEPYNAVSAAVFIIIVLYWAIKLRGTFKTHTFMNLCVPILAIGSVGGTIYHAFRLHIFFMYMDWVPILVLCLMASLYFFIRIFGSWKRASVIVGIFTLIQVLLFQVFSERVSINVSYGLLALFILTPLFWWLKIQQFAHAYLIWLALGSFTIALFFRIADRWEVLEMGTHFLWHTFGALACHCLFSYVYKINQEPDPRNKRPSLHSVEEAHSERSKTS